MCSKLGKCLKFGNLTVRRKHCCFFCFKPIYNFISAPALNRVFTIVSLVVLFSRPD